MPILKYNQEEMWKIYEKLPEELKQAVFSAENADHTFSICERHEIDECSQVASLIGLVLMGVLLPRDFQAKLLEELEIPEDTASRVAQEVNRFIFFPVKQQLEELHRTPGEKVDTSKDVGVSTPRHSERYTASSPEPEDDYIVSEDEENPPAGGEIVEEPTPKKADQYRESID